jgi:hypothetical protein
VFGEPLASNGLPLWIRYSGFQASCHNIFTIIVNTSLVSKGGKSEVLCIRN